MCDQLLLKGCKLYRFANCKDLDFRMQDLPYFIELIFCQAFEIGKIFVPEIIILRIACL